MKKKILALTGIRSDYDLMSGLYRLLQEEPDIELKLLVAGAHLSTTYGRTVEQIERDGFDILLRLETLLDSDSPQARLKSASLLMQSSIDLVAQYEPDLILYAGDREEVMAGALLGAYLGIPTLHFYGGDHVQDSHVDNPVRHAVSKLSTAHLVCLNQHRERLLRMGEPDWRIFTVGNMALDRFEAHVPAPLPKLLGRLGLPESFAPFALLIFHPVTEERSEAGIYFENILLALRSRGLRALVGAPNSDPGSRTLIQVVEKYAEDSDFHFFRNLDRDTFVSVYKHCRLIIGNSSSGILESASVPVPAVNVGLRQRGRFANPNVLFCGTHRREIEGAIDQALSPEFQHRTATVSNAYGKGNSARRALEIIQSHDFRPWLYKNEDPLQNGKRGI